MWDVRSLAYKESKTKQKKMEELADKLGFVETVLCLHRFLFLSSSSVSLFYVSVTALNKSAMWKISVCCDLALGSAREARGGRGGGESFAEL